MQLFQITSPKLRNKIILLNYRKAISLSLDIAPTHFFESLDKLDCPREQSHGKRSTSFDLYSLTLSRTRRGSIVWNVKYPKCRRALITSFDSNAFTTALVLKSIFAYRVFVSNIVCLTTHPFSFYII